MLYKSIEIDRGNRCPCLKLRANALNMFTQHCRLNMLSAFAQPVDRCWEVLSIFERSLDLFKHSTQQRSTFSLFCTHWCVSKHCLVRLHSSLNNVELTHAQTAAYIILKWRHWTVYICIAPACAKLVGIFYLVGSTSLNMLRAFAHIAKHRTRRARQC